MIDRLANLQLFVRVARLGSISKAAREQGLTQPSASRAIVALEREVGVKLLTRSTRAVVLTEAGADYLARIEPVLDALEDAGHSVRRTGELRGTLRIAMPSGIAIREVIPRLPGFADRHPALRLHLLMDDGLQDLLRDGVDVALRFGPIESANATARRVASNPRLLVASPSYLARVGMPETPEALAKHRIVFGPPSASATAWTFERGGKTTVVRVDAHFIASANDGATAAAVAGMGIVSTGLWGCRAELERGTLVQVLSDWTMAIGEIHAVFPAGRAAKPAARAFVDYLLDQPLPDMESLRID